MKLFLLLMICAITAFAAKAKVVELTFTFWGTDLEAKVVTEACEKFNKAHPNIKVTPMHIPTNYTEKLTAMVAAGTPPHIGYLYEPTVLDWASQGILYDLSEAIKNDSLLSDKLPQLYWYYDGGKKIAGITVAAEFMITYYNKDLFDKAKVPYPPTKPEEWTWDKFVETAKKLTFDSKGRTPYDPNFDPDNIVQYGAVIPLWWCPLLPLIWSNGGDIADETGTKPMINSPETMEALQKIYDLIYKEHAAAPPTVSDAFPSSNIALQTGQVAMVLDGQWSMQEAGEMVKEGSLNLGLAPMPYFKKPVTGVIGTPIVIFKDAVKNDPDVLNAALEFHKFIQDPENVLPLIRCGLWQPTTLDWYTKEEYINKWLNPEIHPAEYKAAVIDYYPYARPYPISYLKNSAEINTIFGQEMTRIFYGNEDIVKVCNEAAERLKSLLVGRYDR
ncbi:ABC transporter substrate-binding protein [Pseudothermotoga elfii]|jgi:multiple sugar transport system substrate-binding protein|uniref:ABC transporter substrate-binding protein n=3 Tax=Pseudothermotoga TaxID=1643951 RepID=UPI001E5A1C08|nr:sugar ABC transporter substrate-binding protein [Pseudothermotoga elfii]